MAYFDDTNSTIIGTDSDDVVDLTSSSPAYTYYNVLAGAGNDAIYVGPNIPGYADVIGGDGVDTLFFVGSSATDINLSSGYAVYGIGWSFINSVENVFGGSGSDSIVGDGGNNLLNGGDGGDALTGGGGIDTVDYRNSDAAVSVNLGTGAASGGHADSDTIGGFERAWGSAFDDTLTGDAGRNQLVGYSGDDLLSGGAGADVLRGLDGADTLDGGMGADRLTGGADDDVFVYNSIAESRVWTQRDTITDFQAGDKIDLSAIDANASAGGDQAFHFVAMFDGTAGALRYGVTNTGITVLADLDGDRHIDFAIDLAGVSSLSASDFIL